MPIVRNDFDRFTDTAAADRACLTEMALACIQVAQPVCPYATGNLSRSHTYELAGDHVDVGVTADYGDAVHNGTSKREGRPWLRDAATANAESIRRAGMRAWEGAMR